MTLFFQEILDCVQGKIILKGTKDKFNKLSIDTRKISGEDIFLAIGGSNFDGNKYVIEAIKKGVKLCLIDKEYFSLEDFKDFNVSIILVENTLHSLEKLACYVRSKLDINIVAVTGSVGKTTTKDLVYSFLSSKYKVYKSFGNFNNHLGMPISLINIDDDTEIGVFELGMSGMGEIDYLAKILKPNVALITNIGVNHMEFLKTKQNILRAKMEIVNYFTEDDILILNNEDEMLKYINSSEFKIYKVGLKDCDLSAYNVELKNDSIKFNVIYDEKEEEIRLPILGKHNVLNSILALKVCDIFNIPMKDIRMSFGYLKASAMRQEVVTYKGRTIINDFYNASPDSMISSIDVLNLYSGKKACILGDMNELGEQSEFYHKQVGEYLNNKIDKLVVIGKYRYAYIENFEDKQKCYCFQTIEDFSEHLIEILEGMEIILIKASRSLKFEKIMDIFKEKF